MTLGWLRGWHLTPADEGRWVMVDAEASGLEPARDRLLAIGAVGLYPDWEHGRLAVRPGDSFEVIVRQDRDSTGDDILVHGIGLARQRTGDPAADALAAFWRFAGSSPLLGFHVAFDRELIERASAALRPHEWLDVAQVCAAACPDVRARSLDEWLGHFRIPCLSRHQAAADALAQSELLMRVWPAVARECREWRDLARFAARHRWLRQR